MQFYFALIAYISSLVAAFIVMIVARRISVKWFYLFLVLHFSAGILYLLFRHSEMQYYFLSFICSGLILFGFSIRQKVHLLWKIYSAIFISSLLLFITAPSLLITFLMTASFTNPAVQTFAVKDNYQLTEQSFFLDQSPDSVKYKLIKKRGIFQHTVRRDLSFGHKLDSIKVLNFEEDKSFTLRGYFHIQSSRDSVDLAGDWKIQVQNEIEKR